MAKWGEIKCPRCEELEAKLADAIWRFEHLEKYGDTDETRAFAADALAAITEGRK